MARHLIDETQAPYKWGEDECTYVIGSGEVTLGSTSFGSCVGLVMHCPATGEGVVAHFSGSLGNESTYPGKAVADTKEILNRCSSSSSWNVWVFGGDSIAKNAFFETTAMKQTKNLVDLIRDTLDKSSGYTFAYKTSGHPGHYGVQLNCKTGEVTWEGASTTATETPTTRKRSGSSA